MFISIFMDSGTSQLEWLNSWLQFLAFSVCKPFAIILHSSFLLQPWTQSCDLLWPMRCLKKVLKNVVVHFHCSVLCPCHCHENLSQQPGWWVRDSWRRVKAPSQSHTRSADPRHIGKPRQAQQSFLTNPQQARDMWAKNQYSCSPLGLVAVCYATVN